MEPPGYIYIRTNKYWDIDEVCKFGETDNIPNRESIYITSEPKRGKFIHVIQINSLSPSLKSIEDELKKYFTSLGFHRYIDGGSEFFTKDIAEYLFSWFETSTIQYKILTDEEIDALTYNKTSGARRNAVRPRKHRRSNIPQPLAEVQLAQVTRGCGGDG